MQPLGDALALVQPRQLRALLLVALGRARECRQVRQANDRIPLLLDEGPAPDAQRDEGADALGAEVNRNVECRPARVVRRRRPHDVRTHARLALRLGEDHSLDLRPGVAVAPQDWCVVFGHERKEARLGDPTQLRERGDEEVPHAHARREGDGDVREDLFEPPLIAQPKVRLSDLHDRRDLRRQGLGPLEVFRGELRCLVRKMQHADRAPGQDQGNGEHPFDREVVDEVLEQRRFTADVVAEVSAAGGEDPRGTTAEVVRADLAGSDRRVAGVERAGEHSQDLPPLVPHHEARRFRAEQRGDRLGERRAQLFDARRGPHELVDRDETLDAVDLGDQPLAPPALVERGGGLNREHVDEVGVLELPGLASQPDDRREAAGPQRRRGAKSGDVTVPQQAGVAAGGRRPRRDVERRQLLEQRTQLRERWCQALALRSGQTLGRHDRRRLAGFQKQNDERVAAERALGGAGNTGEVAGGGDA